MIDELVSDTAEIKLQSGKSALGVYDFSFGFLNDMAEKGLLFYVQTRTRASAATRKFVFKTGAKYVHAIITIASGLAAQINLYESPDVTVEGSAVPIRCYNRNFADDTLLAKLYGGSTYSGGTNISPNQSGFGSNPGQAISGVTADSVAYIFKPNTYYAYEVIPDASCDTLSRSIIWETEPDA